MAKTKQKHDDFPPWFPHAAVPPYLHVTWWFFFYHFMLPVWAPLQFALFGRSPLLHKAENDGRHSVYGYTCRSLFYTLVKELHDGDSSKSGRAPPGVSREAAGADEDTTSGAKLHQSSSSNSGMARTSGRKTASVTSSPGTEASAAEGASEGAEASAPHAWSCRGKKILVSPLMHRNGFLAVMQNACKDDPSRLISLDLDVNPDCTGSWRLVVPDLDGSGGSSALPEPSEVGMIVITHMFGVRYGVDWCEPYRRAGALIVEDTVQGGPYTRWRAQPGIDVSLFSAGQDKLPTAMGGGIMATHSQALAKAVADRVDAYPQETMLQRLWFMLLKIPTFLLYNQPWFLVGFSMLLRVLGKTLFDTAHAYRKANSGFDHDNFERAPSAGLLLGLQQRFTNPLQDFENTAMAHRKRLRQGLSPEARAFFFPWYQAPGLGEDGTDPSPPTGERSPAEGGMQELSAPNDAGAGEDRWCDPSEDLCIYQHVHVGEDRPGFLRQLQAAGFIVTHQQTWAAQDADRWGKVLGRMCLMPAPVALSGSSIDAMAGAMEQWFNDECQRLEREGRGQWGATGAGEDEGESKGKGKGKGKGRKRRGSRGG